MKLFSLSLFLISFSLFSQNGDKTCEILSKINILIQQEHHSPKPVDDSLSVFIFDNLINDLDSGRNLFYKSEYDSLSKNYRLQIDNLVQKEDCQFIATFEDIYQKALLRNKSLLEKLNKDSLNFNTADTIRMYKKAFPVYMTEKEFEKIWRKKLLSKNR